MVEAELPVFQVNFLQGGNFPRQLPQQLTLIMSLSGLFWVRCGCRRPLSELLSACRKHSSSPFTPPLIPSLYNPTPCCRQSPAINYTGLLSFDNYIVKPRNSSEGKEHEWHEKKKSNNPGGSTKNFVTSFTLWKQPEQPEHHPKREKWWRFLLRSLSCQTQLTVITVKPIGSFNYTKRDLFVCTSFAGCFLATFCPFAQLD